MGLLKIYASLIRPCFDSAGDVYHSMLTKTQSDMLERMQQQIMKIIFGFDTSYQQCLSKAGLDYLSVSRFNLCERFALKTVKKLGFGSISCNASIFYFFVLRRGVAVIV